ncbi:hypothetical protein LP417_35625 (plasmid) [Polaromonas sp. P1-6]|nr:hypothetical protein LP417_35625 [Polaromonas sp. P1-6]
MSSEYIYGRKAVNIKGVNNTYTALFIESHSSNTFPHNPHWSLYAFSKKENAMDFVLRHVHYCDGGLTRGPRGVSISGEYEIGRWREAIAGALIVSPDMPLHLAFCNNHYHGTQLPLEALEPFKQIVRESKAPVEFDPMQPSFNGKETVAAELANLNLGNPVHADLIWRATQEIMVSDSLRGNEKRPVPAYVFMHSLKGRMQSSYNCLVEDRESIATPIVKSDWVIQETITKFEFPYDDDPAYTYPKYAVTNWTGRILSTDPERWFCTKLIELEAAQPGSAESAYRKFKRLLKALPVSPYQGITIEVIAAMPSPEREKLAQWVLDDRAKLFESAGYEVGHYAVYTSDTRGHQAAMALSGFFECNLAVPEKPQKSEKPVEQLCLLG